MKTLILMLNALCFATMIHGAEVTGAFWVLQAKDLQLSAVATELRDPRKTLDEPWVVAQTEYRLRAAKAEVVVTEGNVPVLDPKRHETPTLTANTTLTQCFAASFVSCKEDGKVVLGLRVLPRREPREPDRGMAAVYLSVRADSLDDAIAEMESLLDKSRFRIGAYGKAEPADEGLNKFVRDEVGRLRELAK